MFWDEELTPEDEEETIEWVALQLYKYGMETAGIMFLESLKPISRYGSSMGQVFLGPMLPFFGDNVTMKGEKALRIFERDENVEKLVQRLEYLAINGPDPKNEIKDKDTEEKTEKPVKDTEEEEPKQEKSGWRRFLPF